METTLVLHPNPRVHSRFSSSFDPSHFYRHCKKHHAQIQSFIQSINEHPENISSEAFWLSRMGTTPDPFSSGCMRDLFYLSFLKEQLDQHIPISHVVVHHLGLARCIQSQFPHLRITTILEKEDKPVPIVRWVAQILKALFSSVTSSTPHCSISRNQKSEGTSATTDGLSLFELFVTQKTLFHESRYWGPLFPHFKLRHCVPIFHFFEGAPSASFTKKAYDAFHHIGISPSYLKGLRSALSAAWLSFRARQHKMHQAPTFLGYNLRHLWKIHNHLDSGQTLFSYSKIYLLFKELKQRKIKISTYFDWYEGQRLDIITQRSLERFFPECRITCYLLAPLSEFSLGRNDNFWKVCAFRKPDYILVSGRTVADLYFESESSVRVIGDLQRPTPYEPSIHFDSLEKTSVFLFPLFDSEFTALESFLKQSAPSWEKVFIRLHPATPRHLIERVEAFIQPHKHIELVSNQTPLPLFIKENRKAKVFTVASGAIFDLIRVGVQPILVGHPTEISHVPSKLFIEPFFYGEVRTPTQVISSAFKAMSESSDESILISILNDPKDQSTVR